MRVLAANRQADAALRQAVLSRREHVAELFNRAVGQLEDENLTVRLGAIYTLRQIGEDFPDLAGAVYKLLAAHLGRNPTKFEDLEQPADVAEILDTLKTQREIKR